MDDTNDTAQAGSTTPPDEIPEHEMPAPADGGTPLDGMFGSADKRISTLAQISSNTSQLVGETSTQVGALAEMMDIMARYIIERDGIKPTGDNGAVADGTSGNDATASTGNPEPADNSNTPPAATQNTGDSEAGTTAPATPPASGIIDSEAGDANAGDIEPSGGDES